MTFTKVAIGNILLFSFIGCGSVESSCENNVSEKVKQDELSTTLVLSSSSNQNIDRSEPVKEVEDTNKTQNITNQESNSSEEQESQEQERTSEDNSSPTTTQSTPVVNIGDEDSIYDTIESEGDYKRKFINKSRCNQIIDKEFLTVCYDFKLKEAKSVYYSLEGDLVNELNIKERPHFYEDEMIDEPYRAKIADYNGSGYDRGHLAPDASFDWSSESLEVTYALSNIIPQVPVVNREMWVKAEEYARDKAVELGKLDIVNVVKYSDPSEQIGKGKIAVSIGYYKILYNKKQGYEECFYYANDKNSSSKDDKLLSHKVNCAEIIN
jgi:endonuclease G